MDSPLWTVSEPDASGRACHSLTVAGPDTIERARAMAFQRIAELGLECGPPGVVGRGDHAYVELHVRAPTDYTASTIILDASPSASWDAIAASGTVAVVPLDGHHDIVGEGL